MEKYKRRKAKQVIIYAITIITIAALAFAFLPPFNQFNNTFKAFFITALIYKAVVDCLHVYKANVKNYLNRVGD